MISKWTKGSSYVLIGLFFFMVFALLGYAIITMGDENHIANLDGENGDILQNIDYEAFSKIEDVTGILADDDFIRQFCRKKNASGYNNVLIELNTVRKAFGMDLCYIMDMNGLVIASSIYPKNTSLLIEGHNYGFRPYFTDAVSGKNGLYPAIGTTTNERGIYFSSPIRAEDGKVIGVVVCKIGMEAVDRILASTSNISAITTNDGIVFSSNRKDWLYKTVQPLSRQKQLELLSTRQFLENDIKLLKIQIGRQTAIYDSNRYYVSQKAIGTTGWTILSLSKQGGLPLLSRIQLSFSIIIVIVLLALMGTIIGLVNNMMKRILTEEKDRKLSHALQQSSSIVVITDRDGIIEYVNPKFSEVTGYEEAEILGKSTNVLKSDQHDEEFYKKMWTTILSGKDWRGSFCNKRKNGELYWEDTLISSVRDHRGKITNFIAIKEDITERRELDEILNRYASTDEMTGTLNRRYGMQLVEQQMELAVRHRQHFVLIFMDINGLKSVNDTLGHGFGDELITLAVNTLKACLRESDAICRLGGDEFLLILPKTNMEQANHILQRIHENIGQINNSMEYAYILSLSFGASEYSAESRLTLDELIRIADENMYRNKVEIKKQQGPNGILRS